MTRCTGVTGTYAVHYSSLIPMPPADAAAAAVRAPPFSTQMDALPTPVISPSDPPPPSLPDHRLPSLAHHANIIFLPPHVLTESLPSSAARYDPGYPPISAQLIASACTLIGMMFISLTFLASMRRLRQPREPRRIASARPVIYGQILGGELQPVEAGDMDDLELNASTSALVHGIRIYMDDAGDNTIRSRDDGDGGQEIVEIVLDDGEEEGRGSAERDTDIGVGARGVISNSVGSTS